MKTILLIRHGKAGRGDGVPDRDRPLTGRGKKQALEMATLISVRKVVPDIVVSSPAKRALETARVMADVWGYDEDQVLVDGQLYDGSAEAYTEALEALPEPCACVALVAHNPAIGYLAELFSSGAVQSFSPCSVAVFRVQTDQWAGCEKAQKQLLFLAAPEE